MKKQSKKGSAKSKRRESEKKILFDFERVPLRAAAAQMGIYWLCREYGLDFITLMDIMSSTGNDDTKDFYRDEFFKIYPFCIQAMFGAVVFNPDEMGKSAESIIANTYSFMRLKLYGTRSITRREGKLLWKEVESLTLDHPKVVSRIEKATSGNPKALYTQINNQARNQFKVLQGRIDRLSIIAPTFISPPTPIN